jgi:TonB-linked outer membrane protein, SusC/RagA family
MKKINYGKWAVTKQKKLRVRLSVLLICLIAGMSTAFTQNKKVTGTVTDNDGEPLTGVSVVQKGTTNGNTTDLDGKFDISVPSGATLSFSYIGYVSQDVIVGSQNVIDVRLAEDTQVLEEVVVVGYGVQKKSSVTGAISSVSAKDIQNRTITNANQALQGKTAGVQVISPSAQPGSSPEVRIRGLSSNYSSSPLYVVDGRIAENGIGGIDPNDIESMEVLKDASSTAIYGIAAGNGVVLVTTKKGRTGTGRISYDFQSYIQSISRVPQVMNSEQYVDWMTSANYLSMDAIMQNWDFTTNTNWSDAIFTNSVMQRHNLSFSGGGDMGNYYAAVSYLSNDGYIEGDADKYSRMTSTINASFNVKPWLEIGTNNQVEYYERRSVAEGSEYGSMVMTSLQLDPLTAVKYAPDNLPSYMQQRLDEGLLLYTDKDGNYYSLSPYQTSDQYNPFIMRDKGQHSFSKGFNVNGVLFANFKPLKGLVITSRFGYSLTGTKSYNFNQHFWANGSIKQDNNQLSVAAYVPINYQWENFANYTHSFGLHNMNAMVGSSIRESINFNVSGSLVGKDATDLGISDDPLFAYPAYASATATKSITGGEETKISWFSIFGRITYDYANKYFVQASLRRDGADISTLPLKNRYGYFPAASVGWDISQEKFMENMHTWLSQLKLRASWGQNGSASMLAGAWKWNSALTHTNSFYPFTSALVYTDAYYPNLLGNPELGWEKSEQLDLGFDARLLSGRMTIGFDYFNKTTKDLIIDGVTLSTIVGNTASPINAGSIENKGIEIELGWNDKIGRDFSYGIKGNLATLKNEVTSIHESLARINGAQLHTNVGITVFEPGYPAWYIRGYQVDRIDKATGNPMFVDQLTIDTNNDGKPDATDGIINDDDKTMIGKPMADFTYGITLTASYKGFDFSLFGTGAYGNDILMCLNRGDRLQANTLKVFYDDRWTPENPQSAMAKIDNSEKEKYWMSDDYIYSGSFFKIKQIQLGYTLPHSLIKKALLTNVRLYCSLDDFVTFTNYPGFDPETTGSVGMPQSIGLDKGSYPSSKKVVFGLNITF